MKKFIRVVLEDEIDEKDFDGVSDEEIIARCKEEFTSNGTTKCEVTITNIEEE